MAVCHLVYDDYVLWTATKPYLGLIDDVHELLGMDADV